MSGFNIILLVEGRWGGVIYIIILVVKYKYILPAYSTVVDIPRWPTAFTTPCLHPNLPASKLAHDRAGRRP